MRSRSSYYEVFRADDWPKGLTRRVASFRFRRQANGVKVNEVWGQMELAAAINLANRYNCDIQEGRNPVVVRKQKSTTVREFLDGWIKGRSLALRPKSLKRYRSIIVTFVSFLDELKGADSPVSSLIEDDIQGYITSRASKPIMPNGQKMLNDKARDGASRKTLYLELTLLKQAFKKAVESQYLSINPCVNVFNSSFQEKERNRMPSKVRYLTQQEEIALLDAAGQIESRNPALENLRNIFSVFIGTGLREQELRWLEWADVDYESNSISVREKDVVETRSVEIPNNVVSQVAKMVKGRSGDEPLFRNEKALASFANVLYIRTTDALREIKVGDVDIAARLIKTTRRIEWKPKATEGDIPMSQSVREILRRLQSTSKSNFVFGHADGGSCRIQLWELVQKSQVLAGITRRIRLHDLRHTFAVRLRRKGVKLEVLQKLMRHADRSQTEIYAPYDLTEGQQAIALLDAPAPSGVVPLGEILGEIGREKVENTRAEGGQETLDNRRRSA